jgi:hypothetical protein
VINILEWFACAFGIIGAFTVATNTPFSGYGYIPFFLGAIGYLIVAYNRRDVPLFLLNLVFAMANTIGIVRWIM